VLGERDKVQKRTKGSASDDLSVLDEDQQRGHKQVGLKTGKGIVFRHLHEQVFRV
jgi:hypothetical protein